jgi:hypothetical protein
MGILISPREPAKGQPLRVIVVSSTKEVPAARLVARSKKRLLQPKVMTRGGPPYWWFAQLDAPRVGAYRFALLNANNKVLACDTTRVRSKNPAPPSATSGQWPVKRSWGRITESFYSAWIEKLFDEPAGAQPSWTPLHVVIRDSKRNFLYNHLGAREDGPKAQNAVVVKPDCADLPFFLRAYFAWKMRLPFGHRHCDRGNSKRAARCQELKSHLSIPPAVGPSGKPLSPAKRFSRFLRLHVSLVHSGAGRTAPEDNETDLFPVALSRTSLRPGTVYVDPYGHLLVVAKWVNQTASRGGLLYAVDGHPDLSVGRKRFWKGAFLFSDIIKGGAGGFKAFRPLVYKDGQIVAMTNQQIKQSRSYGNYSDEQYKMGIEGFYNRMDRIINPQPLSPLKAYQERLDALYELILERVGSVNAGEAYMKQVSYKVMKMPRGPRIFETRGPWENFSTPARDLRLLIAFHEVKTFPKKVVAYPQWFALRGKDPVTAKREMEKLFKRYSKNKSFSYTRSDGSSWTVTMQQLFDRRKELEMAYNPNDCVEIRWGARGKELSTCKRHAPADQLQWMKSYRSWFATRKRPPIR